MSRLDDLTTAMFAAWVVSEVAIGLVNAVNRLRGRAETEDRFSYLAVSFAVLVTVFLAVTAWQGHGLIAGFGSAGALRPLLGWVGCACLVVGIAIRLAAVATLRRQFTTMVAIVAQHRLVDSGLYRRVRHPAYLGLLLSLLGFGLCSGNWVSLAVAAGLPFAAIVYRIRVEERALLRHFGPAYAEYAGRTQRLVPGIY
ncbi:MAG: isoprenylcysteine carboxylmethyltransferase family protein [Anaerolineales bacterium]